MNNLQKTVAIALCSILPTTFATSLEAQETTNELPTVIVSAHGFETEADKVGSAVTIITSEDIERGGKKDIVSILKEVPSLDVIQNGGAGGNTSVFIRGANSEHTLVVLDGIELNNPSLNNRAFNFADLQVHNVERIEILRGPQSLQYGSDALGGVIAIYTKKGNGDVSAGARFEGGSYETYRESADVSGEAGPVDFSVSAAREDTDSISAAGKQYGNSERDSYDNTSFSARAGVSATEQAAFNVISRYYKGNADIDNSGGVGGDDPNRELENEMAAVRGEGIFKLFNDSLESVLGVGYTDHQTNDDNDPDEDHPGEFQRSEFNGELLKFDLRNRLKVSDELTLQFGVETEEDTADSYFISDGPFGPFESRFDEEDMRTTGVFSEALVELDEQLFITAGGRWDDNSESGSEGTYRVSPVFYLPESDTRFISTIGTGFKAPSLFQLFSSFGNEQLDAETSFSWEVGVEQSFCEDTLIFGATWFRNTIDNLITFDDQTFVFENIDEARLQGLELFTRVAITDQVHARVDYTYTETKDLGSQRSLLRRARNKFSAELFADLFDEKATASIKTTAFSSRADNDFSTFPAERKSTAGYFLVDIATEYQILEHVSVTLRGENIFDTEYEEVLGFGTRGATVYGGFKVRT